MKSQKQSVVDEVKAILQQNYSPSVNVLTQLTPTELENVKINVTAGIRNGTIEYSKDRNNYGEVLRYARSMVMNHVKKARELNGGTSQITTTSSEPRVRSTSNLAPKGVDVSAIPEYMKDFVKKLV